MFVHAEPGLLALLLYGAVRLLPPRVTDDLTFSTYEPYHRNFRDYKLARVVGTYLGSAEKGLDTDLGTVRGVALDTFEPARSSPAAAQTARRDAPGRSERPDRTGGPRRVEVAPGRAARHRRRGRGATAGRQGALVRARGVARVDAGEADIDEMLVLQEDRLAAEELKARGAKVWPVVKSAALDPKRADVRTAFRELLAEPERVKELWDEAFEALLMDDFRTWDARWAVLREVAPGEAKKLLAKLLASEKNESKLSKLPTDVRARLRSACAEVGLLPPRPLLVPIGLGELEPLLAAPPDWAGYTAFVLMAPDEKNWLPHIPAPNRAQMRRRARDFLQTAPGRRWPPTSTPRARTSTPTRCSSPRCSSRSRPARPS